MAKNYIQILPANVFELRFGNGQYKGQLRATGGMNITGEKFGDWPKENSAKPVPRHWLKIPGGTAFDVRFNGGKNEGLSRMHGAYAMDGYKYGVWSELYTNGNKAYEGEYAFRGQKHGHWQGFHPNGQKHYDRYYDSGVPFGYCQVFFDNGQRQHEGVFAQNGIKEGEWVEYNKDGGVLWHVLYQNGKKTEKWQTPDGPKDYIFTPKTGVDQFLANDDLFQKKEISKPAPSFAPVYKP